MKQLFHIAISFCVVFSVSSVSDARVKRDDALILKKTCEAFADNWVGVDYHYQGGKGEFLRTCFKQAKGKELIPGMWEIRKLIADGHADFAIDEIGSSKVYPLMFEYDFQGKALVIGASFNELYVKYVGQAVATINEVPAMEVVKKRAALEPQSTRDSSLEIAARTLTFLPREKPYPDIQEKMVLKLEGGEEIILRPLEWISLRNTNPYAVSKNRYPSIWGSIDFIENKEVCKSENDISRVIELNDGKWFWWHVSSLGFDANNAGKELKCWSKRPKNIKGVILDLRDTAGGEFLPFLAVSYLVGGHDKMKVRRMISLGNESVEAFGGEERVSKLKKEKRGYFQELPMEVPEGVKDIEPWNGELILITNGLCGSACDILAEHLSNRSGTCSFGSPTAGRVIGTSDIKVSDDVSVSIPMREVLTPTGKGWEGKPFIPQNQGFGGVVDALKSCGKL